MARVCNCLLNSRSYIREIKVRTFLATIVLLFITTINASFAHAAPRMRGVMISPNVQAADLQLLGETWNINFVRWQLNWEGKQANSATMDEYDAWLERSLARIDSLLPVCERYGIKVLIDLHTTPGGNDAAGYNRIFTDPQLQAHFVLVWEKIAKRYAGNVTVWGYDLANEPASGSVPAGMMDWHTLAVNLAQRIRAIDQSHALVVEPLLWGKAAGFTQFAPLPSSITNVVYSFHMYYPNEFTHQRVSATYNGVLRYPGMVNKVMWDKAQLRRSMQPAIDFQKKYGVAMLVGEFSAVRWAPAGSAYNYLRDLIDIFETNGWGWAYHAFREWNGWSVEHGENKNDTSVGLKQTNRAKLLRSWFARNQKL